METSIFSITDNDTFSQYLCTNSKGDDIFLRMKKIENSIATLYFTNHKNAIISIPKKITVYTYNNYTHERTIVKPYENSPRYGLFYTDDYEIEFYGQIILSLKPQRVWKMSYTCGSSQCEKLPKINEESPRSERETPRVS